MKSLNWLPDWEKASQYPDPKNIDDLQWAWEFLRRNSDYQKDYKTFGSKFNEWVPEIKNKAVVIEPRFTLPTEIREKYKLHARSTMPQPDSEHPYTDHFVNEDIVRKYLIFDGSYIKSSEPKKDKDGEYIFKPKSSESEHIIAIYFDLEMPLDAYIDKVSDYLHDKQKKIGIKKGRSIYENFQLYLRLLDARSVGVKQLIMASTIFPDQINADNRVSKALKAAKVIRDETYYLIPARTGAKGTPTLIVGGNKKGK